MAALALPEGGGVPEWIKVLPPPGQPIRTHDGRGPYRYADAQAVIAASLARKPRLVVDENHSTEIAPKLGGSSPARGYVLELQARADGIWARIDWTDSGRALMADRAYWGVSPVILLDHPKATEVRGIKSVALTNEPNLRDLPALHHEETAMFHDQLAEALGLNPGAAEDALLGAVRDLAATASAHAALQSGLGEIASALGVDGAAAPADILAAARRTGGPATVAALQAEVANLTQQVSDLSAERARTRAEAFIDSEMAKGRMIPSTLRAHYVSRHMQDADAVELEIAAMGILTPGKTAAPQAQGSPAPQTAQQIASAAQAEVAKAAAQGIALDYLTAVQMVTKG